MKSFLPVAALALLPFWGACHIPDGGDLHASWSITQGTAASTCAAIGGDTVEVVAISFSGSRVYQELYDCDDLNAQLYDLRPGAYDLEITLYDLGGYPLSQPFSIPVQVRSDEVVEAGNFEFNFPAAAAPPTGRFSATWVITVNGVDATCGDVGGALFQIVAQGPAGQTVHEFDCDAGSGVTDPLPAGSYIVSVRLLDEDARMLNSAAAGATLPLGGGETLGIGEFEFAFSYRRASFAVKMGGADAILEEVVLTRTGADQCLLATVSGVRDAGGEVKTTPTCSPFDRQGESVVHAIERLQNGQYWLQVRGYIAVEGGSPAPCYLSSNIPFTVNNGDVNLGTIMAPFNDSLDPQRCRR